MDRCDSPFQLISHLEENRSCDFLDGSNPMSAAETFSIFGSGHRAERLNRGVRMVPSTVSTGGLLVLRGAASAEVAESLVLAS